MVHALCHPGFTMCSLELFSALNEQLGTIRVPLSVGIVSRGKRIIVIILIPVLISMAV